MELIEISEDALPILKDSITLKKKLNNITSEKYLERLKRFEKKYNMKSETFIREFEAGNLGDDEDWFDWLFVWEAWNKAAKKRKIIDSLSL